MFADLMLSASDQIEFTKRKIRGGFDYPKARFARNAISTLTGRRLAPFRFVSQRQLPNSRFSFDLPTQKSGVFFFNRMILKFCGQAGSGRLIEGNNLYSARFL